MAIAITCSACGFVYGFRDEEVEYMALACPLCRVASPAVEVEVDRVHYHPAQHDHRRVRGSSVPREAVPSLIDALDVTLALWIAEAMLGDPVCAR